MLCARMRIARNALETALDCLGQRVDMRSDALQMAADKRMHFNFWCEALPFRRKIPAATHDIVGKQQGDRSVIGPRPIVR